MSEAKVFRTRGPINPDKQIYIERPEDTKILQTVRREDYVTLLGARQTGKTSLLYMLRRQLTTEIPVFVDLSKFSRHKGDDWYACVANTVVERLPQELRGAIGNTVHEQFSDHLLREIANALHGTDRIVFLLDEIGTVPGEIRDDFFSTIRSIYNEREVDEFFQKYIFVLSGATPPAELISHETKNSPFNVSKDIYMSDFSLEGVRKLGENLRLHGFKIDDSVIEHIYDWTHGHPNLTQEIFARLVQANPGEVTEQMVNDSVDKLVAEGCHNLSHIIRRVQAVNQQVLGILNGDLAIPFSLSNPEVLNLYLIGVIGKGTEGECVIRNKIYEEALIKSPPRPAKEEEHMKSVWGPVKAEIDEKLCFVMMPFSDAAVAGVYEQIIKPVVEQNGLTPERADSIKKSRHIMADLWGGITKARALIADLTSSNANVYYELGLCHALNKTPILMIQEGQELPFDLKQFRTIFYSRDIEKLEEAKRELDGFIKEALQG